MPNSLVEEFGTLRSFCWPIRKHETRKIIPMLLMLFLICFNYSTLRCMKDSVVVTAAGAEVLPFIKVWVLLPMAVLLTYAFAKLSNRYSQERVFYIMTSGFLMFYAVFAFILYPMQDAIHPHAAAQKLESILPVGFRGLVEMFRYWSFTLFYVLAELWSSIVLQVLFWGFANEITKIGEARRFYSVLSIGANIAAILAGQVSISLSVGEEFSATIPFGHSAWEQTMMMLVGVIILSGVTSMGIFWWMNRNVLNDPSFDGLHLTRREMAKKTKKKLSVRESFSYLSNSKYLLCIAVLVVSYNLVINMVEVIWKDQLRALYPSPADYNHFMNNLTSCIGIFSTITSFFMARLIGRFGWTATAMITPAILLITGAGFFSFLIFKDALAGLAMGLFGLGTLPIAVYFGAAQNCLSKAAKYSVFDTTKEMSFIPLDHDIKLKGKAAIDGVGSRFGKSGGSVIHQGLLMVFGSLLMSASYVAAILLVVIVLWAFAVSSLGKQFAALAGSQQEKDASDAAPQPTQPALA